MTDTQFYVLVTVVGGGLAGIGAAIRFAVNRIVKALDNNSQAMIENTKSNAVLSTKIDSVASFVQRRDDTPRMRPTIPRAKSVPTTEEE